MKKYIAALLAVLTFFVCTACSARSEDSAGTGNESGDDTIVITEKVFVSQINYIYLNAEKYLGRTIKYEGFVDIAYNAEGEAEYYYVIRYGPGCCGTDLNAGFEIQWDGEFPAENEWVLVTGTLCYYEQENYRFLYLEADSIEVLEVRGAEYVS